MIDPADSSLYQTPESFNGLGVRVANDIDASAVIDAPMLIAVDLIESQVSWILVCVDDGRGQDIFLGDSVQRGFRHVVRD